MQNEAWIYLLSEETEYLSPRSFFFSACQHGMANLDFILERWWCDVTLAKNLFYFNANDAISQKAFEH